MYTMSKKFYKPDKHFWFSIGFQKLFVKNTHHAGKTVAGGAHLITNSPSYQKKLGSSLLTTFNFSCDPGETTFIPVDSALKLLANDLIRPVNHS